MTSCDSGQEGRREVFDTFADFLKHFVNGRRLELLEILAQGESSVDRLSQLSGMAITTTSNNCQRLKEAGLVNTRREGTRIFYRLSGMMCWSCSSRPRRWRFATRLLLPRLCRITWTPLTFRGLRFLLSRFLATRLARWGSPSVCISPACGCRP
ncbi:ArsR/SmtB family transcription factor [Corynebacterium casei]|uniref:ArsR/SmtB family transcription factor n=1 Tax=Corynebacterium casei TaxID=160386 RepID=UPI003FD5BAA7